MNINKLRANLRQATLLTASLFVLIAFQNCSDAKFSSGASATNSQGGPGPNDEWRGNLDQPNTNPGSCYTILHQIATDTKLVFVVDNSGSNAGNGGSDPNKAVRGGSIQEFFDTYKNKQNFFWAFMTFKGTTANALINDGNGNPIITNQLPPMQSAIDSFKSSSDSGNTPYLAALNMARDAIANDSNRNANTKWIVVFLSDGLPNPTLSDNQLVSAVDSIMSLGRNQITFNTIYYGKKDDEASGRLRLMAQTGGGKFLDTNANPSGKSFLIANVVNVPGMQACAP